MPTHLKDNEKESGGRFPKANHYTHSTTARIQKFGIRIRTISITNRHATSIVKVSFLRAFDTGAGTTYSNLKKTPKVKPNETIIFDYDDIKDLNITQCLFVSDAVGTNDDDIEFDWV